MPIVRPRPSDQTEASEGAWILNKVLAIAAFGLWAASCAGASAQDEAAIDTPFIDEVRDLALAIGNTYACVDDTGEQAAFRDDAHTLFDLILKDVGSNKAFLYAVSLGYGSAVPQDQLDCPKLLAQWNDMKSSFALVEPEE